MVNETKNCKEGMNVQGTCVEPLTAVELTREEIIEKISDIIVESVMRDLEEKIYDLNEGNGRVKFIDGDLGLECFTDDCKTSVYNCTEITPDEMNEIIDYIDNGNDDDIMEDIYNSVSDKLCYELWFDSEFTFKGREYIFDDITVMNDYDGVRVWYTEVA